MSGSITIPAGTYIIYAAASTGGTANICTGIQIMYNGTTFAGNNNGNSAYHVLTISSQATITVKAIGNATVALAGDVRFSYIIAVRIA